MKTRKIVCLIVSVLLFVSCEGKIETSKSISVQDEKAQINTILDTWHSSASEANFETYFGAMTNESIFIGTDASENWNITEFKEFSKPYFDKGKAWDFKPVERNIYVYKNGEIAWFDELLDTWMGVCRGSGVLKKNNSIWQIEHYVLSLTIPNENIKEVVKINKEKDSLFLSKFKNN